MKKYLIPAALFCVCHLAYWLSGGNFERSTDLAMTFGMATLVTVIAALAVADEL